MNAKHTPGPWEEGDDYTVVNFDRRLIATVAGMVCAETKANVRLLSAAPDLLAACEKLVRGWELMREAHRLSLDDGRILGYAVNEIRAAIAKARGA